MPSVSRIAKSLAAAALVGGTVLGGVAAPAQAAPFKSVTLSFGDWNCWTGKPGTVKAVQVAVIPGNSVNWTNGRQATLTAPTGQRVQVVANLKCQTGRWPWNTTYRAITVYRVLSPGWNSI